MENTNVLFLYSNYSPSCKSFVDNIERNKITFFKYVNIDDKKSRKVLKKIGINSLPCIIVSYNNGEKEIFQGNKAYNWFNKVVSNMNPVVVARGRVEKQVVPVEREESMERVEEYVPQTLRQAPVEESGGGVTSISSLMGEEVKSSKKDNPLLRPKDSSSIVEMAKKMASSRKNVDLPMHKRGAVNNERRATTSIVKPHEGLIDVGKLEEASFDDEDVEYSESEESD